MGGVVLSLPVEPVEEILDDVSITAIPSTPAHIVGVAHVRGRIVTLFKLGAILGLDASIGPRPDDRHSLGVGRSIIIYHAGMRAGFTVEAVMGIDAVAAEAITEVQSARGTLATFLRGEWERDGRTACLIDIDKLLAAARTR